MPLFEKIDPTSESITNARVDLFNTPHTDTGIESSNIVELLTQNAVSDSPYNFLVSVLEC